jgi:annexin A7/11
MRFRTDESVLMELLLNRSNNDIEILKHAYTKKWGSSLVEDVKQDLSKGTKASKLFIFSCG